MNPVIQMTVAVAVVVIAARMWSPILYWLAGLFVVLFTIKCIRRTYGWLRRRTTLHWVMIAEYGLIFTGMLTLAFTVDYIHPMKISAVSILLCATCAYLIVGLLISAAGRIRR